MQTFAARPHAGLHHSDRGEILLFRRRGVVLREKHTPLDLLYTQTLTHTQYNILSLLISQERRRAHKKFRERERTTG